MNCGVLLFFGRDPRYDSNARLKGDAGAGVALLVGTGSGMLLVPEVVSRSYAALFSDETPLSFDEYKQYTLRL